MREAAIGHNRLTNVLAVARSTEDALHELNEGLALARRCGLREWELFMESSAQLELFYDLGRWDDVLAVSKKLLAPEETNSIRRPDSSAGSSRRMSRFGEGSDARRGADRRTGPRGDGDR